MVREDFLEEGTSDFSQPELSWLLKVLAKAPLRQRDVRKGRQELEPYQGLRPFLFLH